MAVGRSPFSSCSQRLSMHISHKPLRAAPLAQTGPAREQPLRTREPTSRALPGPDRAGRSGLGRFRRRVASGLGERVRAASAAVGGSRGSRSRAGGARRRGHGTAPALVTAGSGAARALSASPAGGLALLLAGPGLLLPLLALLLAAAAAARIMSGRRCAGGGAACASAGAEAVEPSARELFEACRNGDVERVKRLVTPEKVNSRDTAGRKSTPLHFAAGKREPRGASRTPHLQARACRPRAARRCPVSDLSPGLSPWPPALLSRGS